MKTQSPQFLRKCKFFLVLPLLVLPFITLLFWTLGGGKINDATAQQQAIKGGLNVELPDAYLKDDKTLDKLSYYEKAALDSAKLEELMKNDPYYMQRKHQETDGLQIINDTLLPSNQYKRNSSYGRNSLNPSPYSSHTYTDPNEAKVYKKLNELNTALNQATVQSDKTPSYSDVSRNSKTSINSADIDRLEQMMDMTKNGDGSEDPEMKQLNGMMEKILDIQHPERVKEKIKQTSQTNKGQVFAVTANNNNDNTSLLVNNRDSLSNDTFKYKSSTNGFFSLNDDVEDNIEQQNSIQAVIHETQTLVEGAIVKLRLMNDIYINGTLIPKDNFVFGTASLNGERLNIKINSIRYKKSLFPVQLSVVDMDGIEGVYVPGAITRDVAKGSAERAVQGIGYTTLDPSLGAQAASAGIEAAKTLLSKKAKLIKVTVKAGYQVLLRDEKQKHLFNSL
jgi:conjugative transposon TraM protein